MTQRGMASRYKRRVNADLQMPVFLSTVGFLRFFTDRRTGLKENCHAPSFLRKVVTD